LLSQDQSRDRNTDANAASESRGNMKKAIFASIVVCFYFALTRLPAWPAESKPVFTKPQLRIAHRCGQPPEETLYACLRSARDAHADILDLDVHMTSDRRMIVMHDSTVDRTTSGTGTIAGLTYAEIRALDAGYRYSENGQFPFRGKGIRVSELSDFFAALNNERYYIEIKPDDIGAVHTIVEIIDQYHMRNKVVVASFHDGLMRKLAQIAPDIARAASTGESLRWVVLAKLRLLGLASAGPPALALPPVGGHWILTPSLFATAHEQGMKIHVWTIDDPKEMDHWIRAGADGIFTNQIYVLNQVVKSARTGRTE